MAGAPQPKTRILWAQGLVLGLMPTARALAQLQDGGQVDPRDAGELPGVSEGVGKVAQQGPRQPVAVEGQCGQPGQRAERRQQLQNHVIREAREAQLHAIHLLPAALQVAGHPFQVTGGQRDA
ncbi:hypothetical protein Celaphus_00001061 [Cervus elaphus hippelaphus]|uniref:Uncharacterized protein n=1 Tax=Cervus elaphus hippelaphus TaxID=46360 RepID=A0A212DAK7_CEREH|nr:hypothetical protein Celaphus_00001061 [Cervus elaphus hippelaphus]